MSKSTSFEIPMILRVSVFFFGGGRSGDGGEEPWGVVVV